MVINAWIVWVMVIYTGGCTIACAAILWCCIRSADRSFVHQWTAEQYKHESEEHRGGCATLHQRVKALVESFEQRTAATVPGVVTDSILPNGVREIKLHVPTAEVPPVDQLAAESNVGAWEGGN